MTTHMKSSPSDLMQIMWYFGIIHINNYSAQYTLTVISTPLSRAVIAARWSWLSSRIASTGYSYRYLFVWLIKLVTLSIGNVSNLACPLPWGSTLLRWYGSVSSMVDLSVGLFVIISTLVKVFLSTQVLRVTVFSMMPNLYLLTKIFFRTNIR